MNILLRLCILAAIPLTASADPRIDSWMTDFSGRYARIYTSDANKNAGISVTTWSNGNQVQDKPAYAGVQEVYSSANWVYLRTTGLGSHIMGPWYLNAARTQIFPGLPKNMKAFYRIPRNPTVPVNKTLTALAAIGYFVDGVAMYDTRDAFYWNGTSEVNGSGNWNRDAYVNEAITFDAANAHQPGSGQYHYHANPAALRYLMGDHVNFNPANKTYMESNSTNYQHSPILGWVRDGFPIYGPYGYSIATNANSGIRRMISGYALRNGQNGTDNLAATGRTSLPAWATRLYGNMTTAGPNVSTTYPLGRYMEDNAYLGDLGKTLGVDFDLDEFNGRFCVTPEFPQGTYAYFVSISPTGTPVFPYNIGRAFYGNPVGNTVANLTETVVTNFVSSVEGGFQSASPVRSGNTVTLTWSSVEGGTYQVNSSHNLATWNTAVSNINATNVTTQTTLSAPSSAAFYRVSRTGIATYDPVK